MRGHSRSTLSSRSAGPRRRGRTTISVTPSMRRTRSGPLRITRRTTTSRPAARGPGPIRFPLQYLGTSGYPTSQCGYMGNAFAATSTTNYRVSFHKGYEDTSASPTAFVVFTRVSASPAVWTVQPSGTCRPARTSPRYGQTTALFCSGTARSRSSSRSQPTSVPTRLAMPPGHAELLPPLDMPIEQIYPPLERPVHGGQGTRRTSARNVGPDRAQGIGDDGAAPRLRAWRRASNRWPNIP